MTVTKSGIGILAGTLLCLLTVLIPSCTHDPVGIEDLNTICFDTQILPILQTSCGMSGCHGNGSTEEGFDVSNYQTIMQAVTPFDPKGSRLYKVLSNINAENMMPPDRPLTREQRTMIHIWIAQGAGETICDTSSVVGVGSNNSSIYFVQDILRNNE